MPPLLRRHRKAHVITNRSLHKSLRRLLLLLQIIYRPSLRRWTVALVYRFPQMCAPINKANLEITRPGKVRIQPFKSRLSKHCQFGVLFPIMTELPRIIRTVTVSIRSRADRNSMHTRIMRSCTRCFFSRLGQFHLCDISYLLLKQLFPFLILLIFSDSLIWSIKTIHSRNTLLLVR